MKVFDKSVRVLGQNIYLRAATPGDADFVYEMRTHAEKNTFLNKIGGTVEDQKKWLESSCADPYQIYFVICSALDERVGLVRVYDQQDDSFCWGSWLIKGGAPITTAIESALLVYYFALSLGFDKAHFDVRKLNSSVWKFHERFGALRIRESTDNYFYRIETEAITKSFEKYGKFLPCGISIKY